MRNRRLCREGFWRTDIRVGLLPWPASDPEDWEHKKEFLIELQRKEILARDLDLPTRLMEWERRYNDQHRGAPPTEGLTELQDTEECLFCGRSSQRLIFQFQGWSWPGSFQHYVARHNVRPSLAFQEFVMDQKIG